MCGLFFSLALVEARSCKDLKQQLEEKGVAAVDGFYKVQPSPHNISLDVFCDMTRDGGGWTLLMSSHTNSWTKEKILLHRHTKPSLYRDYSILKFGDFFMDSYRVVNTFQYRLEAHEHGELY